MGNGAARVQNDGGAPIVALTKNIGSGRQTIHVREGETTNTNPSSA
jgi:hypothetical protein